MWSCNVSCNVVQTSLQFPVWSDLISCIGIHALESSGSFTHLQCRKELVALNKSGRYARPQVFPHFLNQATLMPCSFAHARCNLGHFLWAFLRGEAWTIKQSCKQIAIISKQTSFFAHLSTTPRRCRFCSACVTKKWSRGKSRSCLS